MGSRFGRRKERNGDMLPLYESQSPQHLDSLENENDERISKLTGKVKSLKELTMNIGTEITSSTKLMESMNDSFDSTKSLLSGTMTRLKNVSKNGGISIWMWLAFFCLVALILVLVRF
ncbi:Protein transport protein bet1 [Schizosaccharomyces pombe]|uniref:Protein transport protein bet1 n=1 Tax=Schizosaccharomyces pombe (strain 972 / ATCC 24843) TaxID=284812 RepID=BET1_SCHPO|nr:putative SNARE protein Bet1 [Schizosaccharomyces pombe]O13932.1 RecName: Full=Protein transport protein bet1 [Schizosaccharomyces pombe 972h-]CAB16884.1 SNARE Bet1 (predicted) [Schizosaccharomyces pombe]|eukprot:NP_593185.1 putative SNARE protein Bet1 [Schizosaccharomyces pombe]